MVFELRMFHSYNCSAVLRLKTDVNIFTRGERGGGELCLNMDRYKGRRFLCVNDL